MRVRDVNWGRVSMNSSIRRWQMAKPRPLLERKGSIDGTEIGVKVFVPVGAGH